MNKWLLSLLVLLALLMLVSPGIIGMLTERGLEEAVTETERESREISITTERFKREWFTSAGRHRIALRRGEMFAVAQELAKGAGHSGIPALIINTNLEHGIWPLGSATGDTESMLPSLARSMSAFQIETAEGDILEIPGTLYSEISLTGDTSSRYLLEQGAFDREGGQAQWGGANLHFSVAASGSPLTVSGTIEPWSFETDDYTIQLGETVIDVEKLATRYGFDVGSVELTADGLSITDAEQTVAFRKLTLQGNSEIDSGRLSGMTILRMDTASVPSIGEIDIDLELLTSGIDAGSLQTIIAAVNSARNSSDPNIATANVNEIIDADLQMLLSKGADIHIRRLTLTLPQGALNGTLDFTLPQSDADKPATWAGLTLQLAASANIVIDDGLLRFLQSQAPQLGTLIALGYLRREGSVYKLNAEVDNGLVTINGAPMGIPMTGF